MSFPIPENEQDRVDALRALQVLDSEPELYYDDIVLLASQICDVPIALITLIDEERQWFKARLGTDVAETPREIAFCAWTIASGETLEIPDLSTDPRFAANPLVSNDPYLRFYAGAPLKTETGLSIGSLCVLDRNPHKLSEIQLQALEALARQVMRLLELRRTTEWLAETAATIEETRELLSHHSVELEERFSLVAETAGDAIILANSGGVATFWNRAARDLFGYDDGEVIGRPLTMLIPERYREKHIAGMQRIAASDAMTLEGLRLQLFGLRRDGSEFPMELTLGRGRLGSESFFTGILRDTSAQLLRDRYRLAQIALAETLAALTETDDGIRAGLKAVASELGADAAAAWLSDPDGSLRCVATYAGNPRFGPLLAMLQATPPSAEESREAAWQGDEERPEPLAASPGSREQRAHSLGAQQRLLFPITGGLGWLGALELFLPQSADPAPDAFWFAGQTAFQLDAFINRAEASRALREEQELLAAAEAAAHLGSWESIRSEGRLIWSDELLRIFGITRSEFTGTHADFFARVHPDDRDEAIARSVVTLALNETLQFELRILRSDGAVRLLETTARQVADRGSTRLIGTAQDITERREAELRARQLEKQLEQVRRIDSLGKTAANIAHEFKNVLMSIGPYTELIRRRTGDESEVGKFAINIARAIERGRDLTEEIRQFGNPVVPQSAPLDLRRRMHELADEATALFSSDGISVVLDVDPATPCILADTVLLDRVFTNLLLNAHDAMGNRGSLTIRARRGLPRERYAYGIVPEPESFVVLSISDTGDGIPPEVLPLIFETLFTTKSSGTGLGLALAHQIATSHGGFLFAESEVGCGTTFYLHLPAA